MQVKVNIFLRANHEYSLLISLYNPIFSTLFFDQGIGVKSDILTSN